MGLAWFLVKYKLQFHEYPKFNDEVMVETEAIAFDKFAAHRRFAIKSLDGRMMVEGDTEWMLQNRRENRLERLSNVPELDVYESSHENHFKLKRVAKVDEWTESKNFQVRYLDIDFNSHVNQGFYGDMITVKSAEIDVNTYRMDIENQEGTLLCQIEMTMRIRED